VGAVNAERASTLVVARAGIAAVGVVAAVCMSACSSGGSAGTADSEDVVPADLVAQLTRMEAALEKIGTHEAILENELRYTRGLDRHDEALIRDAYWSDAAVTYGVRRPVSELGPWANETHAKRAAHQHHVTGLTLDVAGDTAHEEGYILFSADLIRDTRFDTRGAPTPGRVTAGSLATLGTGRYVNRYERRDGQWKMIVHEYVHDSSVRFEPVDLCAVSCLGRWDSTDISYLRPLQPLPVEVRRQRAELGKKPHSALP